MGSTTTIHKAKGKHARRPPTQEEILAVLPEVEKEVIAECKISGNTPSPFELIKMLGVYTYVSLANRIYCLAPPEHSHWYLIADVIMRHYTFSEEFPCTKEEIRAEVSRILSEKERQP